MTQTLDQDDFILVTRESLMRLREQITSIEHSSQIKGTRVHRAVIRRCNRTIDSIETLLPYTSEETNLQPNSAYFDVFVKYGLSTGIGVRAYIACKTMEIEDLMAQIDVLAKTVDGLRKLLG
jgi:hypothetical protein